MLKFIRYTNKENEDQKALYDVQRQYVIMSGDYYHDKIDERIIGFLNAVDYLFSEDDFEIKQEFIGRFHPLFHELDFQEDDERIEQLYP